MNYEKQKILPATAAATLALSSIVMPAQASVFDMPCFHLEAEAEADCDYMLEGNLDIYCYVTVEDSGYDRSEVIQTIEDDYGNVELNSFGFCA